MERSLVIDAHWLTASGPHTCGMEASEVGEVAGGRT